MKRIFSFLASVLASASLMAGGTSPLVISEINCDGSITVQATAENKFHFVEWQKTSDHSTVSTANPWNITEIKSNLVFDAIFAPNAKVTVVTQGSDLTDGENVGEAYMTENGTDKTQFVVDEQGDDVIVYAKEIECYEFKGFKVGTAAPVLGTKTGDTYAYTVTSVTADVTVTAVYEITKYSVTINFNTSEGTVTQVP